MISMKYICNSNDGTKWDGDIKLILDADNCYEIDISACGSYFHIIAGVHRYGHFICIPNHGVGCELASFNDLFWNYEQLSRHINQVDALSIATGLCQLDILC